MPHIKTAKILAQEDLHSIYLGTVEGVKYYFVKPDGCNFTPLPNTWWHLEAWSICNRTYRLSKRSDHTNILIQVDIDEFLAEYDRLPF